MNKKLFAVSSLLVGAITLFSSTGCATKNIGKIIPNKASKTYNTTTLNIDNSENTTVTVDASGIALVKTKNYKKSSGELKSTTFTFYNLQANTSFSTDIEASDYDDDEQYGEVVKLADGFYYSTVNYYEDDDFYTPVKTEYTLYDKDGIAFSALEGTFEDGVFVDNSCNRYYLSVNGKVVMESNPLAIICSPYATKAGDYYISGGSIFDSNGKFLHTVNYSEFEIPATVDNGTSWAVGSYYFMQYTQLVHDNEKDYDFIAEKGNGALQKYNLVTKRYDLKKGTVKDVDFDYVVDEVVDNYNDDSVILEVNEIIDKQVMGMEVIQSFDKNGDVLTDLQKLVPGADSVVYSSDDTIVLSAAGLYYAVQKSKVVATFPSDVSFKDDTAILSKGKNLFFYNLNGTQKYAFYNVKAYTAFNEGYVLQFADSIQKYTFANNSIEQICSLSEDNVVSAFNAQYIYVYDSEAKNGDHNFYSLIPGIDSLLELENDEVRDVDFSTKGSYTIEVNDTTTVSGTIYAVTIQNPKDDEETITTYYNYFATETAKKKGFFGS